MWKRILLLAAGGITTVIGAGYAYVSLRPLNLLPAESIQVCMTPENISRGEYLFTVAADCDGCHSQRDLSKFSAPVISRGRGRGWRFPKELGLPGTVVAPNITPDVETGIGAWTDGEKIRAIREGIGRDGRALFPMMPYRNFARMSDDDVQSLVAYMNTLPAIHNPLPRTTLDFPVNYLIATAPAPARNVAAADPNNKLEWGRYLVSIARCDSEALQVRKVSEAEFIERFHQNLNYAQRGTTGLRAGSLNVTSWRKLAKISREELSAIYAFLRTVE